MAQDSINSPSALGTQHPSTITGDQESSENHYKIIWIYWIGSLIVTLCIILAVLPIYWGFWLLGRKTTMSPFETARAFHAPVVGEAAIAKETPILLKEIGSARVHQDFPRTLTS
jgi:hypothetical protein